MAWTLGQSRLARAACRAGKISDEHRKLILRQLGGRALVNGEPTSKAPRLTDADFNRFMATVEGYAGGQLALIDPATRRPCERDHWANRERDNPKRKLVHKLARIINSLTLEEVPEDLAGVIAQATGRHIEQLEAIDGLTLHEAELAVNALRAVAKRHGVPLMTNATQLQG